MPVPSSVLASTGLANAVSALAEHESAKIRGLARGIVATWRASAESDLAEARTRVEELRKLSDEMILPAKAPWIKKTGIRSSSNLVETAKSNLSAKVPKKVAAVVCPAGRASAARIDKMEMEAEAPGRVPRSRGCKAAAQHRGAQDGQAASGRPRSQRRCSRKVLRRLAPVVPAWPPLTR